MPSCFSSSITSLEFLSPRYGRKPESEIPSMLPLDGSVVVAKYSEEGKGKGKYCDTKKFPATGRNLLSQEENVCCKK